MNTFFFKIKRYTTAVLILYVLYYNRKYGLQKRERKNKNEYKMKSRATNIEMMNVK